MNATRHGLTGRTIVMPYEDMEAYHRFCAELLDDLAPQTPVERQYAQTFCDIQWRLNRISSIEDAMIALGHFEEAGNIDTDHPQVHAALTAARVYRDDSQAFANISLYEQRLRRSLDKSLKQLQTLQAERKARAASAAAASEEAPSEEAAAKKPQEAVSAAESTLPPRPKFVFSTAEKAASLGDHPQRQQPPNLDNHPDLRPQLAA